MLQVNEIFKNSVEQDSRTFKARAALGTDIFEDIKSFTLTSTSNNSDHISIGGAVAASVQIKMEATAISLEGKEITLQIGVLSGEEYTYCDLGKFTPEKVDNDDGIISFCAYDRMYVKFSRAYVSELEYPADGKEVLKEISNMTGVPLASSIDNLPSGIKIPKRWKETEITYDEDGNEITQGNYVNPFDGYTMQDALGYVAQFYGKYAVINRNGEIDLRWYDQADYEIPASRYYDDLKKGESLFKLGRIQCNTVIETLLSGVGTIGIQIENPVMTQTVLDGISNQLKDFTFQPAAVSFLGDPRLDIGDIVTLCDKYGGKIKIPIMKLSMDYDGGLITAIESQGKTEIESGSISSSKGPTAQAINRLTGELVAVKEIIGQKASFDDLKATKATFDKMSASYGEFADLTTKRLNAGEAEIENLKATTGKIDDLESKVIKTDEIIAKKADIDLANVNNAWIQNGVIKDGSIGDAAIHDGAITNAKIADATIEAAKIKSINADTISTGTLKTDRLIITGPDGEESIVKAINMANGVPEAEVNSQKIQAASIDVIDLSAFQAKIAGFDMSGNAIYSGKESIKDPNSGIYISTTGIGMGDGSLTGKNEAPMQAYADGSFKLVGKNSGIDFNTVTGELNIEATNLKISSKSVATKDDMDDIRDELVAVVKISSSTGMSFDSDNLTTILTAVVHYGRTVIDTKELLTQTFGTDARLEWSYRKSSDKNYSIIPANDARITQDGFVCTPTVNDIIEETSFRCDLIGNENGQINPDQETVIVRLEKRLNNYVDETLIPGLKDSISGELIKDEYVSKILKNEENITTLQKIIEDLRYVAIAISSFDCNKKVIEIGSTVTDITFTWKINKTPETLLLDGEEMDINSSSYRKTGLPITSRKDFTLKAVDSREATASKTVSVNFYNGVYYGVSAIPETVDSTFIISLQKTLQNTKSKTFNIVSQNNGYIWYALPARYGTPTFNVGGFDGGFTRKEIFNYTNPSGYTEEYWVYRSDNCNLGQKTVKVS